MSLLIDEIASYSAVTTEHEHSSHLTSYRAPKEQKQISRVHPQQLYLVHQSSMTADLGRFPFIRQQPLIQPPAC